MKSLKKVAVAALALAALGIIAGVVLLASYSQDLPSIDSLVHYKPKLVTTIYDRDEKVLASYAQERRVYIPPEEMPKNVVNAFVAAEDDQFYNHVGINPITIIRAAIKNIQAGAKVQGGSTITQQVAKTFLLSSEKSYTRKIKEAILAFQIERALSKDEILNLYLNQIFLGQNSYGVEAASLTYYGKSAKDLSIAEAAVLAGLPRAPSRDNPVANPEIAKVRQKYVLGRMLETRRISEEEYQAALEEELMIVNDPPGISSPTPYLAEHIRRKLVADYGDDRVAQGLSVYTTVEKETQIAAQEALNKGLREVDKRLGLRRPEKRLNSKEIDEWTAAQHKELIEDFYNFKILGTDGSMREPVESDTPTPIELGKNYEAVVVGKLREGRRLKVQIGNREGTIAEEDYKWATEANPEEVYGEKIIRDPYREYRKGDIITVQAVSFDIDEEEIKEQNFVSADVAPMAVTEGDLILKLEQQPLVQGALISYNIKTGGLEAMVGGYDFEITRSHFNRAVQALRQPGSTFKPFVYGAALEQGLTPSTIIVDSPIVYENKDEQTEVEEYWKPNNYGQRFYGDTTLRNAIAFSRNIPTIKLAQYLKVPTIIDFAKRLGVESELAPDLSVALGSSAISISEIVKAWSVFANGGLKPPHHAVDRVLDWEGNVLEEFGRPNLVNGVEQIEAEVLVETEDPEAAEPEEEERQLSANPLFERPTFDDPNRILDEKVAYLITSLLRSVVEFGTGQRVKALGREAAGKTGTTNDFKDAWFIGYTPQMITGVWIGFDGDRPIGRNETGSRAAAPIWLDYMQSALKNTEEETFTIPEGIIQVKVDAQTGDIPTQDTENVITEYFRDGNAPGQTVIVEREDPLESLTREEPQVLRTQVITGNSSLRSRNTISTDTSEGSGGFDELLREDL